MILHDREQLRNLILWFAQRIDNLGLIKLCHLLYLLDFASVKDSCRPMTNQHYVAWDIGPVPSPLYDELCEVTCDVFQVVDIEMGEDCITRVKPKEGVEFSNRHFSRHDLKLMEAILQQYKDVSSKELHAIVTAEGTPFHDVFIKQGKPYQVIPYEMVLDDDGKEYRQECLENHAFMASLHTYSEIVK